MTTLLLSATLAAVALLTGWQLMGSWAVILLIGFTAAVGLSISGTNPRVQLRGARFIRPFEAPALFSAVERLSQRAGLPRVPDVAVVRSSTVNAATIGDRDNATLILTDGILSVLPPRELEAVLAHEIAHIRNRDLSLFRVAEVLRQATLLFTRAGWLLVIFAFPVLFLSGGLAPGALLALLTAPLLTWLLQLALLRTREFAADATAVELTGDPDALARALERIEYVQRSVFRMLLPIGGSVEHPLLRTHPRTNDRVARLRAMRADYPSGGPHRHPGSLSLTWR